MDVKTYCDRLEQQLTEWKARLYDVIRIVDGLSNARKESVYPTIRGLHDIVGEIDTELEELRTACPSDWSPNRQTVEKKMTALHDTLRALSDKVDGPLVPDTHAWVSE
jgi:hypothetical protein